MLNQTSIYALRAMGFLARQKDNSPVLSSVIADEMKIPKNFLSKILNRLVQGGLVQALRGRNGGVSLARPAEQIKLYDIVNLFIRLMILSAACSGLKNATEAAGFMSAGKSSLNSPKK